MKENKTADFLIGVGVVAFGVAVLLLSRALPTAPLGLGSRGYPMFVGVLMVILGLALAVPVALRGEVKFPLNGLKDKKAAVKIVLCAALTFLYVYLLRYIGFLLLTPVFLFVLMMLFEYRKYLLAGVVSVVTTVSIFYLFTRVFYVFLPKFKLF